MGGASRAWPRNMPLHLNSPPSADERQSAHWPSDAAKLTRRSFLALCIAGCSQIRRPARQGRHEDTWALISDTHISSSLDWTIRGSCMATNLQRVIDDVVSASPDHVLFNGDLAFAKGEHGDYGVFRDLITPLQDRGTPLHLTLGNHDHRARLVESLGQTADTALTDKVVSALSVGGVRWLLLDSLERVDGIRGSLGPEQRAWLSRQLNSNAAPAIVCVHHNPEPSFVGLRDFEEFLRIVLPRRHVKLVLFGHTHRFRVWQTDGLHFVNLPAVGFWFNPRASLGWVLARVGQGGMRLELRGVSSREQDHGATRDLAWRSDR